MNFKIERMREFEDDLSDFCGDVEAKYLGSRKINQAAVVGCDTEHCFLIEQDEQYAELMILPTRKQRNKFKPCGLKINPLAVPLSQYVQGRAAHGKKGRVKDAYAAKLSERAAAITRNYKHVEECISFTEYPGLHAAILSNGSAVPCLFRVRSLPKPETPTSEQSTQGKPPQKRVTKKAGRKPIDVKGDERVFAAWTAQRALNGRLTIAQFRKEHFPLRTVYDVRKIVNRVGTRRAREYDK